MRNFEKPIREVFVDICDDKLTNLEIDKFIKNSTNKFKLPKLKRLIIDFEQYIKQERADVIVYFEYMYGDRKKFNKDVAIGDEETLNKIIETNTTKFKNSPEVIHSDYDTRSQEITDFSPLLEEFTTEDTMDVYYESIASFSNKMSEETDYRAKLGFLDKFIGILISLFAPVLASNFVLRRMNSPKFIKTVGRWKLDFLLDDLYGLSEFKKGLRSFLKSPIYLFHIKLHTLYNLLKESFYNGTEYVSEPSTDYHTERPARAYSPTECAKSYLTKNGAGKYDEAEVTFVMNYADKHEYISNIAALVRLVKKDPECPKRIKEKNDIKAERKWIKHFDKMNKIDRK